MTFTEVPVTPGMHSRPPAHFPTIERLRLLEDALWRAMPRYESRLTMTVREQVREQDLDHRVFGHVAPALDVLNNLVRGDSGRGTIGCDCGAWPQLDAIARILP